MFEPGDLVAVPLQTGEHALLWVLDVEPSETRGPASRRVHVCVSRRQVACDPDAEESDFDDPLLTHVVLPYGRIQGGNVVGRATDSGGGASNSRTRGDQAVEAWRAAPLGERTVVDAPLEVVFAAFA